MKKYFIVLILGLFLGACFARSVYGQENYFTPGQTMKALQKSKENSEGEKVKGGHDFYYKQYTYPAYTENLDDFETKYVLYLRSTEHEDVEVNLTYIQPHFIYSDVVNTGFSIIALLTCIQDNIEEVQNVISYCNTCGYEKEVEETLVIIIYHLSMIHDYIKDCALKYFESYDKEDFASCIKQLLNIQINYWHLYTSFTEAPKNDEGYNTISFTHTENE